MPNDYLVISDPRPSQRLFLDSIASCCGSLMVRTTLILYGVAGLTVTVHQ